MDMNLVYLYKPVDYTILNDKIVFPKEYKLSIDKYWKKVLDGGKDYTNGTLFSMVAANTSPDRLKIYLKKTDFSHYLYSQNNFPNLCPCRSVASNALLMTSDQSFVLGKMSRKTSLENKVKFIGGAVDERDIIDCRLDSYKCMKREVAEEMGIDVADEEIVSSIKPVAFLIRKNLTLLNTLYFVNLKIDKDMIRRLFDEYQNKAIQFNDSCELDDIVFVDNTERSIIRFIEDENIEMVEYMRQFFEAGLVGDKMREIDNCIEMFLPTLEDYAIRSID